MPAENELYPPFVRLQWRGIPQAFGYAVFEVVGSTTTLLAMYPEVGRGYYAHETDALDEGSTYGFLIYATDLDGNMDGTPLEFEFTIVRNPEHPSVALVGSGSSILVETA